MKILICVKQVPDDSAQISLLSENSPNLQGIALTANAFDTYALEMAVRFREKYGECEITVLTIGDETSESVLRSCRSVGADKAVRIGDNDYSGMDANGISDILLHAITDRDGGDSYDVVMCGLESTDDMSGQVGLCLAEKLSWASVSNVVGIDFEDHTLHVAQESEDEIRIHEIKLPCVLTVSKPEYDPRYPTLKSKMAARKAPIEQQKNIVRLATPLTVPEGYEQLPKRDAGVKIQEETTTEAALKALAIMREYKLL